jgi:lipopolysaccharide/colanic/teichoic acid biosynthesis glycosyltransferase
MSVGKRAFDLLCMIPGVVILIPLAVVVAFAVKLDDGGPVFFRQVRAGWNGKPFRMWKFRTMVVNAEKLAGLITIGQDPRITRVGRVLRKTKLDELPQFLNVIAGDMSLVGPRPEVMRYVEMYGEDQRKVLELMPGITDPASVKYCDESELLSQADDPERLYVEEIMPEKIRLNLEYAEHASVASDLRVVLKTIAKISGGKG